MNIVWFSRHKPLPSQLKELERLFPNYNLIIDPNSFDSAQDVISRFRKAQGDEMVIVAPLSVVSEICKYIQPIKAVMQLTSEKDPEKEVFASGRWYKFKRFDRVLELRVITEPIEKEEVV